MSAAGAGLALAPAERAAWGTNRQHKLVPACVSPAVVIFEGTPHAYGRFSPPSWVLGRPASHVSGASSEATMRQTCQRSTTLNAGYVYVTDDALPNPWETLPAGSPWTGEVAAC